MKASTEVKNIKEVSHEIPEDVLVLCEELKVSQFVPNTVPKTVSFELHNTSTEVANAFRRCINSELNVLIMDFEESDLECSDPFVIPREIRKSINLIPIKQISDMTFSIHVENKTNSVMYVMSSDIKEEGKETTIDKLGQTFIIAELNPGKEFKINQIKVKSGVGFKDGAMYSYPLRVGYECLNIEGKDVSEIKSTLEAEPDKFRLTIHQQQFAKPRYIVKYAANTLEQKLDDIYKLISESEIGGIRGSDKLEISETKDFTKYKIYNETYTIGNLIVKYAYEIDPSIEAVSCFKEFTSHDFIIIKICHSDANTLIKKAIKRAMLEVIAVGKAF